MGKNRRKDIYNLVTRNNISTLNLRNIKDKIFQEIQHTAQYYI